MSIHSAQGPQGTVARQPAGVPTGGQYAPTARAESETNLRDPALSAVDRLDALGAQHRELERQVQLAAVAAIREQARTQCPEAVYVTMTESEEGPWLDDGEFLDADFEPIEGVEPSLGSAGGWLSHGADLASWWDAEKSSDPHAESYDPFGHVFEVNPQG